MSHQFALSFVLLRQSVKPGPSTSIFLFTWLSREPMAARAIVGLKRCSVEEVDLRIHCLCCFKECQPVVLSCLCGHVGDLTFGRHDSLLLQSYPAAYFPLKWPYSPPSFAKARGVCCFPFSITCTSAAGLESLAKPWETPTRDLSKA